MSRVSGRARREIPGDATILTAFADAHKDRLYWAVCAWREDFTGWLVDYGRTPEADSQTLADTYPGVPTEVALYRGLTDHWAQIVGRHWTREDGTELPLTRGATDSGWETQVVYRWHLETSHRSTLFAYRGMPTSAVRRFGSAGARARGCRRGDGWQLGPTMAGERRLLLFSSDVNAWKTFVMRRLLVPVPSPGCLVLFGAEGAEHRQLARHLTSEVSVQERRGDAELTVWRLLTGRENHWLDCVVGCTVLAASCGAKLAEQDPAAVAAAKAAAAPAPKAEAKPAPAKAGGWIGGGSRGRGWITGY